MYHENCPRSVKLQPKDKFRMVLFHHEHKDPTASKYFKMVQENFRAPPTPNSQQEEDVKLGMTMTPLITMKTSLYDIVFSFRFAFELMTRYGMGTQFQLFSLLTCFVSFHNKCHDSRTNLS